MSQPPTEPQPPYGSGPPAYGSEPSEASWSPVPSYGPGPVVAQPTPPTGWQPTPPPEWQPTPPPEWQPSPAPVISTLPLTPVEYHQMYRTPRLRWWKSLLLIVSFVAAYLIVSAILQFGAIAIDIASGRVEGADLLRGKITLTPVLLLSVNLTNALSIPIAMLLQRAFLGQRGQWLHSVTGRFRWRLLARSAVIVVPIWALFIAASALLSPSTPGSGLTGESIALLVIVLLTTPFQAAGEEYGARGLLAKAAGSWVANPRTALLLATLVSSVLFMIAHGAGDPWLIIYYFLFGVALSIVTWRTGGLEVAVLIHTVNNMAVFGVSILSGQDLSQALDRSDGVGSPAILIPMVLMAALVALVWWLGRRTGVQRRFEPVDPAPALPVAAGNAAG